jgi:predicted transcriptional regulator
MGAPRRRSGGKGGFEPRARIVARAERVFDLSMQGRSHRQIAAELGISQPAVTKILKREEERRLGLLPFQRVRMLSRQAARLEHLFTLAAEGLERSHADRRDQRQYQRTSPNGEVQTTVSVSSSSQAGDPRWLREMARVLNEQRKLLALDGWDWARLATALAEHENGQVVLDEAALTPPEREALKRWRAARSRTRSSGPGDNQDGSAVPTHDSHTGGNDAAGS